VQESPEPGPEKSPRHVHAWKRLFKRPNDEDNNERLAYLLAGWDRIHVCTVDGCGVIAKRAVRTGRMHPLLLQDDVRRRAEEWNGRRGAKGATA